ncbi:hypothetical protein, partial [Bacteroides sp. CAG:633]|uniref:hypothetical protein n=1 Tax=Bacteroides sp. CAG:633 TaxID=1262744 RepID=UPI002584ED20
SRTSVLQTGFKGGVSPFSAASFPILYLWEFSSVSDKGMKPVSEHAEKGATFLLQILSSPFVYFSQ